MFSIIADASKIALVYLVSFLQAQGVEYIDCQQQTRHLESMGARPVAREIFMTWLQLAISKDEPKWQRGPLLQHGAFASDGTACA